MSSRCAAARWALTWIACSLAARLRVAPTGPELFPFPLPQPGEQAPLILVDPDATPGTSSALLRTQLMINGADGKSLQPVLVDANILGKARQVSQAAAPPPSAIHGATWGELRRKKYDAVPHPSIISGATGAVHRRRKYSALPGQSSSLAATPAAAGVLARTPAGEHTVQLAVVCDNATNVGGTFACGGASIGFSAVSLVLTAVEIYNTRQQLEELRSDADAAAAADARAREWWAKVAKLERPTSRELDFDDPNDFKVAVIEYKKESLGLAWASTGSTVGSMIASGLALAGVSAASPVGIASTVIGGGIFLYKRFGRDDPEWDQTWAEWRAENINDGTEGDDELLHAPAGTFSMAELEGLARREGFADKLEASSGELVIEALWKYWYARALRRSVSTTFRLAEMFVSKRYARTPRLESLEFMGFGPEFGFQGHARFTEMELFNWLLDKHSAAMNRIPHISTGPSLDRGLADMREPLTVALAHCCEGSKSEMALYEQVSAHRSNASLVEVSWDAAQGRLKFALRQKSKERFQKAHAAHVSMMGNFGRKLAIKSAGQPGFEHADRGTAVPDPISASELQGVSAQHAGERVGKIDLKQRPEER